MACEDRDYGKYDLTNDYTANLKYDMVIKVVAKD